MAPLTPQQQKVNLGLTGIACSCAQLCVHPSETAMVRQQLTPKGQAILPLDKMLKQLYRTEGFGGLYRGIGAATVREMTYSTLRFGLYEPIAIQLDASNVEANSIFGAEFAGAVRIVKRVVAGAAAGGIASALCSPTDVVKIVAQRDTAAPIPTLVDYLREVAGRPGGPIRPFYEGVGATVSRAVVLGATKMATYNEIKDALKQTPIGQSPATLVFTSSTAAGLAITITTSPFTNARTHMVSHPGKYSGVASALVGLVRDYGGMGLFRGFAAQWARFGPYAMVQFVVWEQLRSVAGLPAI